MKFGLFFLSLIIAFSSFSQKNYADSVQLFQDEYKQKHEVVKGAERERMSFFKIDPAYQVVARFEKAENSPWFQMATTGPMKKLYRVYGVIHFNLGGQLFHLNLYQSQDLLQNAEYKTYLFLPFTDLTTGNECYHGGRYIDLKMEDIKNNELVIDFNKAYNPYCAYVSGKYNCPIPPKENNLSIAIKAGEKAFKE